MTAEIKDDSAIEKEIALSSDEDLAKHRRSSIDDQIPDPDPGATPEERAALVCP